MVETVGVGQTELDIVEAADTTVVITRAEAGDTVQAMKAGLMELPISSRSIRPTAMGPTAC